MFTKKDRADLSLETLAKKQQFPVRWGESHETWITKYLERVHDIHVPANFSRKLKFSYLKYYRTGNHVSLDTIDSIITACKYWEEYLQTEEDFFTLVCDEVNSMVRIHTSVISFRNFKEQHPKVQWKNEVPFGFTTIVTIGGTIQVYS